MKQFLVIPQKRKIRQITWSEVMNDCSTKNRKLYDETGTITKYIEMDNLKKYNYLNYVSYMKRELEIFFIKYQDLIECENISTHYNKFFIPKKNGKYREINAPDCVLSECLRELDAIIKNAMPATYHTTAFAYVKNRSTIDAVKKHQNNKSNWFGKFDFSNFFGATTLDFLISSLKQIFPFGVLLNEPIHEEKIRKIFNVCFLNGGLPQGTPISPTLTNIMMIPFDHVVNAKLKSFKNNKTNNEDKFVYTRYADDIHISCYVEFDIKQIENFLIENLRKINAPFCINKEKTHYGNKSGSNYILGVILNKDNVISLGHKNKKQFKRDIFNYICLKSEKEECDREYLMKLQGKISYFLMVEKNVVSNILSSYNKKYSIDIMAELKKDLKAFNS